MRGSNMKRIRLSKRDRELLIRIVPFGHATVEIIQRWYSWLSIAAVRSWIKRLRQAGWIVSAPLDERRNYYRLSNRAVQYLRNKWGVRVSRATTRPLKPNRKPEKHAWLLFISENPTLGREAYRPAFDSGLFPELAAHLAEGKADPYRQRLFYRAGETIGLFVLDRGHPDFVNAKLKPQVEDLWRQPSFAKVVNAGLFELTVSTSSISRKRELETVINEHPPGFHWQIVVMEEIAALLPRRSSSSPPYSERSNGHENTP